jgi:type IV conjugative transfer system protein TraL
MSEHDTEIVTGLKDPWKFLFLDMDIAMVAFSVGFMALTTGAPTPVVMGVAATVGYLMHASRKGHAKGFAMHFGYCYMPPVISRARRMPPMWSVRTVG